MIKHILTLIWNKRQSNFLLFLEVFFSFAILFAVFSFVIYNLRTYSTPLGFDTEDIWVCHLDFEFGQDSAEIADIKKVLIRELNAKPQIESASLLGAITPFSGNTWTTSNDDNGFTLKTMMGFADEHYARSGGLNIIEGRWFEEGDDNRKYKPIVISKKMRETHFPDKPVLDSLIRIEGERQIIGVIDHFKYKGEFEEESSMTFFYTPSYSEDAFNVNIRLKPGTPASFEEELNQTIAQITKSSSFIIENVENSRKRTSRAVWIPIVALLSICGFLVLNVALGLFGVLWYNISKRRAEIGLRRTLGASQSRVSVQFVGEVFFVALIGILTGAFFAIQVPLLKVVDIAPINLYYAIFLASLLICILVLVCSFYPSNQAARIHPAVALHEE